jgi:hypothetical protein
MDNLTYNNAVNTNRLINVHDDATDMAAYDDIKKGQSSNNFIYDASGNLIHDQQQQLEI